jgi:hypothetical protein
MPDAPTFSEQVGERNTIGRRSTTTSAVDHDGGSSNRIINPKTLRPKNPPIAIATSNDAPNDEAIAPNVTATKSMNIAKAISTQSLDDLWAEQA